MNNIFSLPRFLMLFKKHLFEKGKEYLLSSLTLTIILIGLLAFVAYQNASGLKEELQEVTFVISIILSGMIFTSMIFPDLSDKRKSTIYLTLPASHLEKYLVTWIFSYLIFQLVFTAVFYLATAIVLNIGINEIGNENTVFNIFDSQNKVYQVFYVYLLAHSLMFYGAVYFRKKHFISTIFSLFLIGVLLSLFNKLFLSLMIKSEVLISPPFTNLRFVENFNRYYIEAEKSGGFVITLLALITGILWISAFYRLKEKEV